MFKYVRLIILKIKYVLFVMICIISCRLMIKWERDMYIYIYKYRGKERKKERERIDKFFIVMVVFG